MSIVTVEEAKEQVRVLRAVEDGLLQRYIDTAEYHAQQYLNRNVYETQIAFDAALATVPTTMATAIATRDAAEAAAAALSAELAALARIKIEEDYSRAYDEAIRVYLGMVANEPFRQATLMLVAHWYINREPVVTELPHAIELPFGVTSLLTFDRRQMGV